jgi:hypothetical protein
MEKEEVVFAAVVLLAIFGAAMYGYYFLYGRTAMVLDIINAKEYLWRARSSIDLEQQANYIEKALESLKGRAGNPNWLWRLPDTDFDLIKNDLAKNIAAAREIAKTETKGSYGYQRAIDNIQEVCIELNEHLDIAIKWCTDYSPSTIIFNIIGWAILIGLLIYLLRSF